MHEVVDKKAIS